jgi:hypothetical protein
MTIILIKFEHIYCDLYLHNHNKHVITQTYEEDFLNISSQRITHLYHHLHCCPKMITAYYLPMQE